MWQRWLVIGLVIIVIGIVVFEESTTPDQSPVPPAKEIVKEKPSEDNSDEEVPFSSLDQAAVFSGGNVKMWLGEHINYPQEAIERGIEGRVYVRFIIDKNGNVRNPIIIRGVDPLLDKEVIRVMKTMPPWKPGMIDGKPVHSTFNLPVTFKLQ